MVLRLPGPGSPARATAPAAVGATILPDRSEAKGRQNGGAPPSLTREPQDHHHGRSVSQDHSQPLR